MDTHTYVYVHIHRKRGRGGRERENGTTPVTCSGTIILPRCRGRWHTGAIICSWVSTMNQDSISQQIKCISVSVRLRMVVAMPGIYSRSKTPTRDKWKVLQRGLSSFVLCIFINSEQASLET